MALTPTATIARSKTNFLDLPPELRNHIYDLSGCLKTYQCARCARRMRGEGPEFAYGSDDAGKFTVHYVAPHVCCARPLPAERTPLLCRLLGLSAFWVNRSSHLTQNETQSATTEAVSGPKQLQPQRGCGMKRPSLRHAPERPLTTTQPPLTMVSRQIRRDTLPMFYGNHGFVFTLFDTEVDSAAIEKWLDAIGAVNASLLNFVGIVFRKKKQLRYVEKQLFPRMRQLGVRLDDIFIYSVRVDYPFCCCETCVMRAAGWLV